MAPRPRSRMGDREDQAARSGQAGRRDPADRITVCKQIPPDSVNSPKHLLSSTSTTICETGLVSECSAYWTLMDPDFPGGFSYLTERYGRHEETRTPDLYRVKVAL